MKHLRSPAWDTRVAASQVTAVAAGGDPAGSPRGAAPAAGPAHEAPALARLGHQGGCLTGNSSSSWGRSSRLHLLLGRLMKHLRSPAWDTRVAASQVTAVAAGGDPAGSP
ncbi:hypothetical protein O0L34_g17929 [Tuta absoluta]|nr:hypothetical protein O0L34_g17929 [Tuta absoluta]